MDDTKPCTLNRLPSVQKGRDPCVQAPMYTHTTYPVARAQAPGWWPLAYAYVSLSFDLPFSERLHCVEGGSP